MRAGLNSSGVFAHRGWRRARRLVLAAQDEHRDRPAAVVLLAPEGSGKTLLLSRLVRIIKSRGDTVHLTRATLPAKLQRQEVLLIDDAEQLDDAALAAAIQTPDCFCVLAARPGFAARLTGLGPAPTVILLDAMPLPEAMEFVEIRLAQAEIAPDVFSNEDLAELARRSNGRPGALIALVDAMVAARMDDAPAALAPAEASSVPAMAEPISVGDHENAPGEFELALTPIVSPVEATAFLWNSVAPTMVSFAPEPELEQAAAELIFEPVSDPAKVVGGPPEADAAEVRPLAPPRPPHLPLIIQRGAATVPQLGPLRPPTRATRNSFVHRRGAALAAGSALLLVLLATGVTTMLGKRDRPKVATLQSATVSPTTLRVVAAAGLWRLPVGLSAQPQADTTTVASDTPAPLPPRPLEPSPPPAKMAATIPPAPLPLDAPPHVALMFVRGTPLQRAAPMPRPASCKPGTSPSRLRRRRSRGSSRPGSDISLPRIASARSWCRRNWGRPLVKARWPPTTLVACDHRAPSRSSLERQFQTKGPGNDPPAPYRAASCQHATRPDLFCLAVSSKLLHGNINMLIRLTHQFTMAFLLAAAGSFSSVAFAQTAAPAKGPDSLVLHFDTGSTAIRPQDAALLDQASRLYRDGKPLVMIVTGATDLTGSPEANLRLSEARADVVVHGLVARGIPAERFQILAKGETSPSVDSGQNAAEPENRRVEITWR